MRVLSHVVRVCVAGSGGGGEDDARTTRHQKRGQTGPQAPPGGTRGRYHDAEHRPVSGRHAAQRRLQVKKREGGNTWGGDT